MSTKTLLVHPAERVDLEDFRYGTKTFQRDLVNLRNGKLVLDNQSRIIKGFRVELADQSTYPGRITIHAGIGLNKDGQQLFSEDQLDISKTVTLEGASQTFYIEVEFAEADSDVDARAFWDPTVDQGLDTSGDALPDGQEFGNSVATRTSPNWKITTPISKTNFDRVANPNSTKIPLISLTTNGSNQITGASTEKPSTTLLEVLATTPGKIRVQDPTFFGLGDVDLGEGVASSETLTISSVDYASGIISFSGNIINSHSPGEVIRRSDVSSPDLVVEENLGRYQSPTQDFREFLYRGDEKHGEILLNSPKTSGDRSDINLQALKDHIDMLAAKIQELQWGVPDPNVADNDSSRTPPGISSNFPTTPRYFDAAGGVQGARAYSITVGDGVNSWGDFVGNNETGIQAAITQAVTGTSIFVKRGTYTLANDVTVPKGLNLIFDEGASVVNNGGGINLQVPATEDISIFNLNLSYGGGTTKGLDISSTTPRSFRLEGCRIENLNVNIAVDLGESASVKNCIFESINVALNTTPLITVTGAGIKLQGVWENCTFNHTQSSGIAGCIDASSGGGVINLANFVDCRFLGNTTNSESILASCNRTVFERCSFDSGGSLYTNGHLNISGFDIKIVRNTVVDAPNLLTTLTGATNVDVFGCYQTSSTAGLLKIINGNSIFIKNCRTEFAAGLYASLTKAAFYVTSTSGTISNLVFENNYVEFNSDSGTGIIFDINGGDGFINLSLINNTFEKCETGIYFNATGLSGTYLNTRIEENIFNDTGSSSTVASFQKIGILTDINSLKTNWAIRNNLFNNLNPANTNTVPGSPASRGGIVVANTLVDFDLSGNEIFRVGDSSNPLTLTAGIHLASTNRGTLEGNKVINVFGSECFGMRLSDTSGANRLEDVIIVGNIIDTVECVSGSSNDSYGIYASSFLNSSFLGNRIRAVKVNDLGTFAYGIGTPNSSSSFWEAVIVKDNNISTLTGANGTSYSISLLCSQFSDVVIGGNSLSAETECIAIQGGSGIAEDLVISGNNLREFGLYGIRYAGSMIATRWTITGNTINSAANAAYCVNILGDVELITICSNIMNILSGTGTNINLDNCSKLQIDGNILRVPNSTGGNIYLGTGCVTYIIHNNICDTSGGAGQITIDTATAPTAVGAGLRDGIVTHNLIDANASLNPNDRSVSADTLPSNVGY